MPECDLDLVPDFRHGAQNTGLERGIQRPFLDRCAAADLGGFLKGSLENYGSNHSVDRVDGALSLVRPQLDIGGNLFALSRVSISHTLKMTGSIKASLEEVCELISEGQIELGAEYEKAEAPTRAS